MAGAAQQQPQSGQGGKGQSGSATPGRDLASDSGARPEPQPSRPERPDPDSGDKFLAEEAEAIRQQGDRTQPRTDELGRFVSANQNPFPIPTKYRNGLEKEVDLIHPDSPKNKEPE